MLVAVPVLLHWPLSIYLIGFSLSYHILLSATFKSDILIHPFPSRKTYVHHKTKHKKGRLYKQPSSGKTNASVNKALMVDRQNARDWNSSELFVVCFSRNRDLFVVRERLCQLNIRFLKQKQLVNGPFEKGPLPTLSPADKKGSKVCHPNVFQALRSHTHTHKDIFMLLNLITEILYRSSI